MCRKKWKRGNGDQHAPALSGDSGTLSPGYVLHGAYSLANMTHSTGRVAATKRQLKPTIGIFCINWYNRQTITTIGLTTSSATTSSLTFVELTTSSRVFFLTWGGAGIQSVVSGQAANSTSGNSCACQIGLNGTVVAPESSGSYSATGGQGAGVIAVWGGSEAEGLYYITPMGAVANTGTGTFNVQAMVTGQG